MCLSSLFAEKSGNLLKFSPELVFFGVRHPILHILYTRVAWGFGGCGAKKKEKFFEKTLAMLILAVYISCKLKSRHWCADAGSQQKNEKGKLKK